MNFPRITILTFFGIFCSSLTAFPPAPHHTLYGLVRDQVGQVLPSGQAEIVLLQAGREILRRPITSRGINENYRLPVEIDLQAFGTSAYQSSAIQAGTAFTIAVDLNGSRFYPVSTNPDFTVGNGADFVRLDLNLGEDTDGDGLPDIWEQWQLHQAGILPDGDGNWQLDLLHPDSDFDKDGLKDGLEYIAGTFASDASETLNLKVKERQENDVQFEFFQVIGKTYVIESSVDFKSWTPVDFRVGDGNSTGLHQAKASQIVQATASSSSIAKYFRLTVR